MDKVNPSRASIVEAITSPLGFFALCLLTVEGFLGIALIYSNLESLHKFYGMLIGAGLFVVVVIIVALLVWKFPENLTFGETSWLKKAEMYHNWGSNLDPATKRDIEKDQLVGAEIFVKKLRKKQK